MADLSFPTLYPAVIAQIVTEPLPISSSSHVFLITTIILCLFGQTDYASPVLATTLAHQAPYVMAAHLPMVAILLLFYRDQLLFIIMHCRRFARLLPRMITYFLIIDGITVSIIVCLKLLIPTSLVPSITCFGLMITALLLYQLRYQPSPYYGTVPLTPGRAVILGCAQGIAAVPGISRFAIVFVTAQLLGFAADKALAITWFFYVPLMLVAAIFGVTKAFYMHDHLDLYMLTGVFCGATALAFFLFRLSALMALRRTFWWFCWYLVIPIMFYLLLVVFHGWCRHIL